MKLLKMALIITLATIGSQSFASEKNMDCIDVNYIAMQVMKYRIEGESQSFLKDGLKDMKKDPYTKKFAKIGLKVVKNAYSQPLLNTNDGKVMAEIINEFGKSQEILCNEKEWKI